MEYSEAKAVNGQIVKVKTYTKKQSELTPDCWSIQFMGLSACKKCELRGKDDCGGGEKT